MEDEVSSTFSLDIERSDENYTCSLLKKVFSGPTVDHFLVFLFLSNIHCVLRVPKIVFKHCR